MSPTLEPRDYIGLSAAAASPTPTSSSSCSSSPNPGAGEVGPRLTLRLGLPGSESPDRDVVAAALTLGPVSHKPASKRAFPDASPRRGGSSAAAAAAEKAPSAAAPAAKAQVVGWPPVRNYRKNTLAAAASVSKSKGGEDGAAAQGGPHYVKVSMDGAPYLRKVDLKMYSSYEDLSAALQKMFSCFITGQSALRKPSTKVTSGKADSLQDQEYVLTYEDKDADWMLVGDLPWDLFTTICRKLKIMRGSDAAGIAPRVVEQTGQNK